MKWILAIIIIIIVFGIPILLGVALLAWLTEGRHYPKIKLSEFIKLYYADKENWNTYEFSVQYKENTGRYDSWSGTSYKYHAFRFGYFEFLAYTCWYHYNEFIESRNADKEAYEAFRKIVYKDNESEE